MSKQKRFKQQLKKPFPGFSYSRIWGWPVKPHNFAYLHDKYSNDPNHAVWQHPVFGWLYLFVETCFHKPYSKKQSCLNGSLGDRFFKTPAQARKVLNDYREGRTNEGLFKMIDFHESIDDMEEAFKLDLESEIDAY